MNSFYLAYTEKPADVKEIFTTEAVWKTCLRTIVCFDEAGLELIRMQNQKHDLNLQILKDHLAYQYLLEVICGLKSEIVGETQVLGQFKNFLSELKLHKKKFYLNHSAFFNRLLQDCKELREKHIHHWGGSSYGSLTRKIIENSECICVLGSGQLAQSLIPWLKEKTTLTFARNPKNAGELALSVQIIQQHLLGRGPQTSLVIAAPIENEFLIQLLMTSEKLQHIIDWRTESALDSASVPPQTKYHSFRHLADFMQSEKVKKQKHLAALESVILQKIEEWSQRKQLRPMGWDDLC